MKRFLFTTILLALIQLCNAQHTPHFKQLNSGGYYNPAQPGDTLLLNGSYTYLSFANTDNITIIGVNASMQNGMEFHDCNNVHITGKGGKLVINSHSANPTNIAINIEGKSNHFEIDNLQIDSAQYATHFKTDPQAHPNDSSYWHSLNMDDLYFHDVKVNYIKQDMIYAGNTGQNADRPVTYKDGKVYYPLPATVSNVRVARVTGRNIQRSAIMISGGLGKCYIDSCDISEAGFEWSLTNWSGSLYQGAGLVLGGNCYGDFEIAYNKVNKTFLNNFYSYAAGKLSVHDNYFDSADKVWNVTNQQQNASVLINPLGKDLTLSFYNNSIGYSNNNVQLVVYSKLNPASCVSGVSRFVNQDNPSFGACNVFQPPIDTSTKPPVDTTTQHPAPVDTSIIHVSVVNGQGVFDRKNGTQSIIDNVNYAATNGKRYWYILIGKKGKKNYIQ